MDFLENCRFCLEFADLNKRINIDEDIKESFLKATHIELKENPNFSNFIHKKCLTELNFCLSIKETFVEKQEHLYSIFRIEESQEPESHESENFEEEFEEIIKTEPEAETETFEEFTCIEYLEEPETEDYIIETIEEDSVEEKFKAPKREKPKNIRRNIENQDPEKKPLNILVKLEEDKLNSTDQRKRRKDPKVPCDICGSKITRNNLQGHINAVHLQIVDKFCDYCGKGFYFKQSLRDHLKRHLKIKDLTCPDPKCLKTFTTENCVRSHIKSVHMGIKKVSVKTCELCGKTFNNTVYYSSHMNQHLGHRPFSCDFKECDRSFFSQAKLQRHRQTFHVELTACPLCNREVKNLGIHLMKSHGERKFSCNFIEENGQKCDKNYATRSALKVHFDTSHKHIRNYRCELCSKDFTKIGDLKNHQRNRHENKKIKCEICSTLIGSKTYYRIHVQQFHANLNEEMKEHLLVKIRNTPEEELFNHKK